MLTIVIWLGCVVSSCIQKNGITSGLNKAEGRTFIFDSMEAQGVDMNQPLLYGYFFFDKDMTRLERLSSDLVKQEYVQVELEKNEGGDFTLHVEKVEVHSRDSLREREDELHALAKRFSVETYDGFDVGNADPTKPVVSNESFRQFMNSKEGNDLFDLGIRLYDLEINDRASEVFTECIKQNIKTDISSYKLAHTLFELGKPEEALTNLEQAVKLNPAYADAYFNLGAIYYELGKYQKSLDDYENVVRLRPDDDQAIYGIAAAEYALGKFPQSLENCRKALKINPQNENAKALLEMLDGK